MLVSTPKTTQTPSYPHNPNPFQPRDVQLNVPAYKKPNRDREPTKIEDNRKIAFVFGTPMSSTLTLPFPSPTHSQLVLRDVTWEMYEQLLEIFADYPAVKMSYYQGTLELIAPLPEHETYAWTIGRLLTVLSEELELEIRGLRSTTWRSQIQRVGKEADQCFYIQNEAKVRGKLDIDLNVDPPPDLAIEIDVTHSVLDKLPIYAGLKVPELWRVQKEQLSIYRLIAGEYRESEESFAFPSFPVKEIARFLNVDPQKGENERMREFRQWVRDRR